MLVVLLLIDGLGYDYLPENSFWKTHSSVIRNATPTITLPNWLTILSGQTPQKHQVVENEYFRPQGARFLGTTIFDDFPEKNKNLMISDWAMMKKVSTLTDFRFGNIWQDLPLPPSGLLVLNYQRLDTVGHIAGWGSQPYERVVKYVDRQTQKLFQRLESQGHPFVLLGTADHGGHETGHEEVDNAATRRVPLLFATNVEKIKAPTRVKHTHQIRNFLKTLTIPN